MPRIKHVKKAQGKKACQFVMVDGDKCMLGKGIHQAGPFQVNDHEFDGTIGKCESCSAPIVPGMAYKHVSLMSGPRSSYKRIRCGECPSWKGSELSSSPHRSGIMAIQEDFDASIDGEDSESIAEGIKDALTGAMEAAREIADGLRESAQNIEDGFGHETSQSMELNDRAENLDAQVDEGENWDPEEYDHENFESVYEWAEEMFEEARAFVDELDAG